MKPLIRPTLFLIARLGLFLTVVAWIIGQRWSTTFTFNWGVHDYCLHTGCADWSISRQLPLRWGNPPHPWMEFNSAETRSPLQEMVVDSPDRNGWIPGVAYTSSFFGTGIVIAHWITVVIFALIYGVLGFIYRKRIKEAIADD